MDNEKSQMNALLPMFGPLLPTVKPNNRDKFWSKNRRELDRVGWSGKCIFSDSDEEEEEHSDEIDDRLSCSSQIVEASDSISEQEREDGHFNTSCEDYFTDIYYPKHHNVSESEKGDNNHDQEKILFDVEELAEDTVLNWVVALLHFVLSLGGVWYVFRTFP
ncbi:hypothetical protein QM012_008253 [Aureobasidium pullulans]|uniref:Uncharacterized protein n=1 Tax=Aureobasidium pullulans TaxID=5580 RepID=A0ABR0TJX7_AURPU